ncbi:unnamed protein product [Mesocestoides corti]|uniref:Histone-lysine N-methyltransferase n=1 Tax=Mesocestoides corti TaxID=53468 RepID=A0A0R3U114_MESCO|nr:unnamed protein product [Mesocestoides corti]
MSVDHRDALPWPQKDNFDKEDYPLAARAFVGNQHTDINCKVDSRTGSWDGTTPIKDFSPSSTEPTSMLSDKSSSRGTIETKNSESTCFSTDTGDTEHQISEGSLSPPSYFNNEGSNLISYSLPNASHEVSRFNIEHQAPTLSDAVMPPWPTPQMSSKERFSSGWSEFSSNFNEATLSPTSRSHLSRHGYHSTCYENFAPSRLSVSNAERTLYHHMHLQYESYSGPNCHHSYLRKVPTHFPMNDPRFQKKPDPCVGEAFCPSAPQKVFNCQSNRPPNPFFWRSNNRPSSLAVSLHESIEARRRFAAQPHVYPHVPMNRRLPEVFGQEFYHRIQDRVRHPQCSRQDPYDQLYNMSPGYNELLNFYPDHSISRIPKSSCSPSTDPRTSSRFIPTYPWVSDMQRYLSHSKPFRPVLENLKKRNTSSFRGSKRKRAPCLNEEKCPPKSSVVETYDPLTLGRLLSLNVSQCVSSPDLEIPVDLYPPEPALKKRKLPCHEVPSASEFVTSEWNLDSRLTPRCGLKYTSLPFILRVPDVVNSENFSSFLKNDKKNQIDLSNNFLSKAFASAIARLNESRLQTAPPSPTTPNSAPDPLYLFTPKRTVSVTSECLLVSPKRRRITDVELSELQKRHRNGGPGLFDCSDTREIYSEKRMCLETFKPLSECYVCQHCGMQVLFCSGPIPESGNSSSVVFCSETCKSKYSSAVKQRRPSLNTIPNALFSDPVISQIPVLIHSPPSKLCKNWSKASSITKYKSRPQRELLPAITTKRWQGPRWTVFSSKSLTSVSRADMTTFAAVPKWLKPEIGGNQCFPLRDTRTCELCKQVGDANESIEGRLLNYTCDRWIHVNCILWCYEAYETLDGCLMNVSQALEKASLQTCTHCHASGAGLPCFAIGCPFVYHVHCAYRIGCSFHEDRSMFCPMHLNQAPRVGRLETLNVSRRVYLARDEYSLVEDVIGTQCLATTDHPHSFRVGTLILNSIGQLLPEHLESGRFHNSSFIYPVGFSTTRIYWSYRRPGRRCRYTCTITDSCHANHDGSSHSFIDDFPSAHPSPVFTVTASERGFPDDHFRSGNCNLAWQHVLTTVRDSRKQARMTSLSLFPVELQGEDLFGLCEPHIVRAIESLPGVEHLREYVFKFGKMQLITKMPIMINPTGCARSEPKLRTYVRSRNREPEGCQVVSAQHQTPVGSPHLGFLRPLNQIPRTCSPSPLTAPTGKQSSPIMSKYQQYRRLRFEWKNNVLLARSKIQGLGLFAARDIDKHEFIIEYLGQMIRNEVGNRRERLYESQNRGIYMFRADDECIVDATMYGGLARYINHSCEPNCIAEVFAFEAYKRIIIIAKRFIKKGEELTYDYKFDFEDDKPSRIPCLCGSQFCRKWMN